VIDAPPATAMRHSPWRTLQNACEIATSEVEQAYVVIRNAAKLSQTVTISDTLNLNKSTNHNEATVTYSYDALGRVTRERICSCIFVKLRGEEGWS